jgi:hypothetical protein
MKKENNIRKDLELNFMRGFQSFNQLSLEERERRAMQIKADVSSYVVIIARGQLRCAAEDRELYYYPV